MMHAAGIRHWTSLASFEAALRSEEKSSRTMSIKDGVEASAVSEAISRQMVHGIKTMPWSGNPIETALQGCLCQVNSTLLLVEPHKDVRAVA